MYPKISCLTVTKNRPKMLRRAIQCYEEQTYRNKELVILSQSDDPEIQQIASGRNDILYVRCPIMPLGALRNLSIELSTGDILCQWDDDDIYHPHRLATQFKEINAYQAVASAYTQFLKYFTNSNELYWVDWSEEMQYSHRYLPGTVMFHKSIAMRYKGYFYPENGDQSKREEDLNVLELLTKQGWIAPVRSGNQYIYVFHGENVYDFGHHQLALSKILMDSDQLLLNATLIEEATAKLPSVSVRSKTGQVFCTKGNNE